MKKRALLLIKEVPDNDNVQINEDTWTIKRGVGVINPYDYSALNLALELKKEGYQIEVMTMGPVTSKRVLTFCLSLGFNKAYLVTDPLFAGSDTFSTSFILSYAIKHVSIPDIILTGSQSFDGSTGHVPLQIGQILGINSFSNVISLNNKDYEKAEIIIEIDKKYVIESNFPFIVSMILFENYLVLPSAKNYFGDQQKNIIYITNSDLNIAPEIIGLKGSPTKVVDIKPYLSNRLNKIVFFNIEDLKNIRNHIKSMGG